jgi:hypothetical protein
MLLLTQADDPLSVAARLRLDEHLAIIRVVFYEENAGTEEGDHKPDGSKPK